MFLGFYDYTVVLTYISLGNFRVWNYNGSGGELQNGHFLSGIVRTL